MKKETRKRVTPIKSKEAKPAAKPVAEPKAKPVKVLATVSGKHRQQFGVLIGIRNSLQQLQTLTQALQQDLWNEVIAFHNLIPTKNYTYDGNTGQITLADVPPPKPILVERDKAEPTKEKKEEETE